LNLTLISTKYPIRSASWSASGSLFLWVIPYYFTSFVVFSTIYY
jgi:hypothetical protein